MPTPPRALIAYAVTLVPCLAAVAACGGDPPKPDRTAPIVTLAAPSEGASVSPDGFTVSGSVIDPKVAGQRRSGVAELTVNGVAATLGAADATGLQPFTATLAGLQPGSLVVEAVAADGQGNLGSARVQVVVEDEVVVPPGVVGLIVEPTTTLLESVGASAKVTVYGIEPGRKSDVTAAAQLTIEDEAIASVAADGTVTAKAAGRTRLIARQGEHEVSARVAVELDRDAPAAPDVSTYRPETSQRSQVWIGVAEPRAHLRVSGAAEPIERTLPGDGRFMLSVPLSAAALNPIVVTLTDAAGNSQAFDYPIRQNDAFRDPGVLKLSDGDHQRGIVGQELPRPLVVRVTDVDGNPLPGMDVDFVIVRGEGSLAAGGTRVRVTTDGGGRASATWRLGPDVGERHEVHAALLGDSKLPAVFRATGLLPGVGPTSIKGRVLDSDRNPVVGLDVTLLEEGAEFSIDATGKTVQTDALGGFVVGYAPEMAEPTSTRLAHVRFDGTRRAAGARYVRIDYVVPTLPAQENEGGVFYVPALPEGVALDLDANGVVQTAATLSRAMKPGEPPTIVHVPVGTKVTWPANVPAEARKLTLLDIPVNRTPMALPDGLFSQHVLALQPGGTRFDPPLPVELPNLDGLAPQTTVPLFSYDHLQTRFVQTGSSTVDARGDYVVSDPGSGIRVGAWHISPPKPPPPKCPSEATVKQDAPPEAPKPEKKLCTCQECDKRWACWVPSDDEDGKIRNPEAPCTTPGDDSGDPDDKKKDEPPCKLEIICEDDTDVVITLPAGDDKKTTVKTGDTVTFKAACPKSEDNATIQWRASGGDFVGGRTGQSVKVKFPDEGRFTVTAAGGAPDKCEGHDDRVIEAKTCIDVGVTRVCGDTFTKQGDNTIVSGGVSFGLVSEGTQFLRLDKPVTAVWDGDSESFKSATGDARWSIDTELVSFPIKDLTVWRGPFELDDAGKATFTVGTADDDVGKYPLRVFGMPILVKTAQLLTDGVGFDLPDFKLFSTSTFTDIEVKRCDKPRQVSGTVYEPIYEPACVEDSDYTSVTRSDPKKMEFLLTGLEVRQSNILPQGKITLENAEPDFGVFKLAKLELGYENDTFSGAVGVVFGRGVAKTGIELGGKYGTSPGTSEWRWKEVSLSASFSHEIELGGVGVVEPGIPVVPPTFGPLFLNSASITAEDPLALFGGEGTPKLSGSLGLAFGPGAKVGDDTYALATGTLDASWSPESLTLGGTVSLLGRLTVASAGLSASKAIEGLVSGTATATYTVSLDGLQSLKFETSITLKEPITGLAVVTGSLSGSLAQKKNPDHVLGIASGSVSITFPATAYTQEKLLGKIEGRIRSSSYATGSKPQMDLYASIQHLCFEPYAGPCIFTVEQDPVNGLRMYFQVLGGVTVSVLGKHPNEITSTVSAPSLGVSRGVGWRAPYDGSDPTFDLADDDVALDVLLDHDGGPVLADLELPDGTLLVADQPPAPGADGNPAAIFYAMPGGRQSYWLVSDASAGTYRLVNVRGASRLASVSAAVQARAELRLRRAVRRRRRDRRHRLARQRPRRGRERHAGRAPGRRRRARADRRGAARRRRARLGSERGGARRVRRRGQRARRRLPQVVVAKTPIVVAAPSAGMAAPALVRAVDGPDGILVGWLPSAGAERYVVAVIGGGRDARGQRIGARHALVPGRLADGDAVQVLAIGADDATSASVRVDGTRAPLATRPAGHVTAGATWRYAPERLDGTPATLALVAGPAAIVEADGALDWATTVDDVGAHDVTLTVDGVTVATTVVVEAAAGAARDPARAAGRGGRRPGLALGPRRRRGPGRERRRRSGRRQRQRRRRELDAGLPPPPSPAWAGCR
ncbi:MAG: PKD domain-containing protein [Myxococcota bacterium]